MATADVPAVRIASAARDNGWVQEVDFDNLGTGGTYNFALAAKNDPSAAKSVLSVTSPGYDATGSPITAPPRTVYGTQWERKAYPNQAVADESTVSTLLTSRIALSDYIYSGDTVTAAIASGLYTKTAVPNNAFSGSVTNNSTLAHPKCIGRWAMPGYSTVSGTFRLRAVVFHRSAKAGKPVAAVVFTVTDGTTTKTVTATGMVVSDLAGTTGCGKVLEYQADFLASDFIQSAVLTCNFKAYPWVGDSGATLDSASGITPPDERLCPLKLVNDKNLTYAGGVAVVDATNGHNSTATTWVAASQSAAETAYGTTTNSYSTIGNAVQAITAYNNANLGRNNPGGGVILLTGNHAWPGTSPGVDQGAMDAWVTITRLSSKTRSQCAITSGTNATLNTQRIKCLDITLSGNSLGQLTGTIGTNVLWLDQCTINMTGTAPLYQFRMFYVTRCDVTAMAGGFQAFGAGASPYALIRGNAFTQTSAGAGLTAEMYCCIGNKNLIPYVVVPGSAQASDNGIYAFNQAYFLNNVALITDPTWTVSHGLAFVQNVLERMSSVGASVLEIHAGNCAAPTNNILQWHNTYVGERHNGGYNDAGTTAYLHRNWSEIGNVFTEWNNKDDTFTGTPNAARTGSWPVGYAVGHRGNHRRASADPEWMGEFFGIYTVTGGAMGFVTNKGNNYNGSGGDGLGGGDYHLIPSGSGGTGGGLALLNSAVLPFDLDGTARVLVNGDAGAFESQTAPTPPAVTATAGWSGVARKRQARVQLSARPVLVGKGVRGLRF